MWGEIRPHSKCGGVENLYLGFAQAPQDCLLLNSPWWLHFEWRAGPLLRPTEGGGGGSGLKIQGLGCGSPQLRLDSGLPLSLLSLHVTLVLFWGSSSISEMFLKAPPSLETLVLSYEMQRLREMYKCVNMYVSAFIFRRQGELGPSPSWAGSPRVAIPSCHLPLGTKLQEKAKSILSQHYSLSRARGEADWLGLCAPVSPASILMLFSFPRQSQHGTLSGAS